MTIHAKASKVNRGADAQYLPPPVQIHLDEPLRTYWLDRVAQHPDSYAGIRISKFPEDLRVYEHLLWLCRPNVIIELGTQFGGSALWFRDRLRALESYGKIRQPRVVAVDRNIERAARAISSADPDYGSTIELISGDVTDPDLPDVVARSVPSGSTCLVVEDSAHTYDTTRAALAGFSRFVPEGGFMIIEDGCVDVEEMRLVVDWPRGVLPAIHDWLETEPGQLFEVRRDMELYGISCHPEGFLQRTSDASLTPGGKP